MTSVHALVMKIYSHLVSTKSLILTLSSQSYLDKIVNRWLKINLMVYIYFFSITEDFTPILPSLIFAKKMNATLDGSKCGFEKGLLK